MSAVNCSPVHIIIVARNGGSQHIHTSWIKRVYQHLKSVVQS